MIKAGFSEFAEKIGVKLGVVFSRIPISANMWTVLAVVPALFGFFALSYYRSMEGGLVLFALSALIDAIDGGVARVTGTVSNLGAYLDGMMDRIVEALLLFGLMGFGLPDLVVQGYATPAYGWIALLLFVGTTMVSYSRAYASHRNVLTDEKKLRRMGGLLERAERLCLVFIGMAAYFYSPVYLTVAIASAAILSCITLLQRILFVVMNAE